MQVSPNIQQAAEAQEGQTSSCCYVSHGMHSRGNGQQLSDTGLCWVYWGDHLLCNVRSLVYT